MYIPSLNNLKLHSFIHNESTSEFQDSVNKSFSQSLCPVQDKIASESRNNAIKRMKGPKRTKANVITTLSTKISNIS